MSTLTKARKVNFDLRAFLFHRPQKPYVHPYLGGALLGVVLFLAFFLTGNGLGASGGLNRYVVFVEDLVAPSHVDRTPYLLKMAGGTKNPLDDWIVFVTAGAMLGGFISGWLHGRLKVETGKGPHISTRTRWMMAFLGGAIMGYGARMARGCTSGQALSGGATLAAGSWALMFAIFGGAYLLAYFVRRLWTKQVNIAPFPLPLEALLGKAGAYLVYLAIGFFFGFVLEISGFGHSPKLAAQFYFKDLTVLKVMFTAIVTAMVLIFLASGLGLLDYNLIWVNPTYLWPGILGGFIMGIGFIIGGFCPGTSLVSAATLKIDGIFFALGSLVGVFAFGETVHLYERWWNDSYYGRLTLMDVFHLPAGVVVLLVVLMAIFMFWGGEQLERIFGQRDLKREPKGRLFGAAALTLLALAVLLIGQPTTAERWARLAAQKEAALARREVQIHPGELYASLYDDRLNLILLDVRSERDYNLFHLRGARHVPREQVASIAPELLLEPAENTVFLVMSNDEAAATEAWKILVAESVPNVYILEGGINHWLAIFGQDEPGIRPAGLSGGGDNLRYLFPAALGDRYHAADPGPQGEIELQYTPKIKLQRKRGPSGGGCG